jgi:serine/threonine protein kinase
MPKYGMNLESYFMEYGQLFSDKTILQIGICMIKNLQIIHAAGYTYNDLKLDNILVGNSKG